MPTSRPTPAWLIRYREIETPAAWFALANALDAALTYILLMRGGASGERYVEGNRIPAYFLHHWGFRGLFGFKVGIVLFVCGIAAIIAIRRPETAKSLLHFATLLVGAVVVYSTWLAAR